MIGLTIDSIAVGDSAQLTRRVSDDDIAAFVHSVGDYNPVHSDHQYAAGTVFEAPIAPGIWTAGLVSAVIGTRLPGPGAIYVSQELKFLKPVKSGDSISARVEVIEVSREKNRIRLRTMCTNQRAEDVLSGEAVVMPSRTPIDYTRPAEAIAPLALWMLQPLAWMAQGASIMGMLGLSALSAATPAAFVRPPFK